MQLATLLTVLFLLIVLPAAAQKQPNIVIFSFDDLRPLIGSYNGKEVITPHLDALAQDAVQFNRAYVTYPVCSQSRAAMMTGLRFKKPNKRPKGKIKWNTVFNNMINTQDTWARIFKNNGYWLGTRGKLYHGSVPESELEIWDIAGPQFLDTKYKDGHPDIIKKISSMGGKKEHLQKYLKEGKGDAALIYAAIDGPDNLLNDGKVADEVITFLARRDKTKPFVISAGFSRPHMPFVAPKKYFDLYPENAGQLAPIPAGKRKTVKNNEFAASIKASSKEWNEGVDDKTAQQLIRGYMASVTFADAQMGKIIAQLKKQNLYQDTIIIMWGDHGYHLTDHGLWRKLTPYEVATHMPLMIKAPGMQAGKQVEHIVQNTDIYPTMLELAGIAKPQGLVLHGNSLVPILKDPSVNWNNIAYSVSKRDHSIITPKYRFTKSQKGNRYLFDLENDPHEWQNLADKKAYQKLIKRFEQKIKARVWNEAIEDKTDYLADD